MGYRMLALPLALGAVLAAGQGSAFAAVAAQERVARAGGITDSNKSATATCSAGKRVLGTGARIGAGDGEVGVVEMVPNAALTGATVRAVEDGDGFASAWSLDAFVLCATPPPGLERIVATSSTNSANKGVSAACPAGKRLLGTGAAIGGGGGEVVLRELIPNSALTSVSAFAAEDENGFAGNWGVTAYAVCANPVGGLQRQVATSANNSTVEKSAAASCPAGKRVTGGGGRLTGGSGQVRMDELFPFPDPAEVVSAVGIEDQTGFAGNWSATAYAICVNSSERVVVTSPTDSNFEKNVGVSCASDKAATGAGGDISGGVGEVLLTDLVPLHAPPVGTLIRGVEDQTGTARNWSLRAYAICSTPLPGLERMSASSLSDSSGFKQVVAACPAGKRVVGAGGNAGGAFGEVVMDRVVPNAALTSVTVRAQEDEDFTSANWSVSAYALCANPPPGLQLTSATSELDSDLTSVVAGCPSGKNLLGAGGELGFGVGEVVIDDLRPDALLTNVTVTGVEDETGAAGNWSVTAYAICANV